MFFFIFQVSVLCPKGNMNKSQYVSNFWKAKNVFGLEMSNFIIFFNIYRPQRSCGRVMFLHLSVSHSVHRVGGCVLLRQTPLGRHPLGRHIPLEADTPLGRCPRGRQPPGQTHPLPQAWHPTRQYTPSRGIPPPETATAADVTHPNAIHSCSFMWTRFPGRKKKC